MKKLLIGCGIVFVLIVAVVVAGGYWLYKQGSAMIQNVQYVDAQYRQYNSEFSFAPSGNVITEEQMARWLAVRNDLSGEVGRFEQVISETSNPLKLVQQLGTLARSFTDAHISALRAQQMSNGEYSWISQHVVGTLNSQQAQDDPDLAQLATSLRESSDAMNEATQNQDFETPTLDQFGASMASESIQQNIAVLKPHVAELNATQDVFMADFLILPMIDSMNQSFSTGQTWETPAEAEVDPMDMPATAPAEQ